MNVIKMVHIFLECFEFWTITLKNSSNIPNAFFRQQKGKQNELLSNATGSTT